MWSPWTPRLRLRHHSISWEFNFVHVCAVCVKLAALCWFHHALCWQCQRMYQNMTHDEKCAHKIPKFCIEVPETLINGTTCQKFYTSKSQMLQNRHVSQVSHQMFPLNHYRLNLTWSDTMPKAKFAKTYSPVNIMNFLSHKNSEDLSLPSLFWDPAFDHSDTRVAWFSPIQGISNCSLITTKIAIHNFCHASKSILQLIISSRKASSISTKIWPSMSYKHLGSVSLCSCN